MRHYDAIVIGTSQGGLTALTTLLSKLPKPLKRPVFIVQHRHPDSDETLLYLLNKVTPLNVVEAEDKAAIEPGNIYVAPANYHLLIESPDKMSLSVDERINYSRPSIDVLFESAADVFQSGVVGIILTGANSDGSQGIEKIKKLGGLTMVQDPKTAESAEMPQAAIKTKAVDHVLTLEGIARVLAKL